VTRTLAARLSRAMVRCYPGRWRQRYRDEVLDVLDQHQATAATVLSLAGGALTAHLDPDFRMERPVIRIRKGVARTIAQMLCVPAGLGALLLVFIVIGHLFDLPDFAWHPIPTGGTGALALTPDQRLLATEVGGEPTSGVVNLWSVGPASVRLLSSFEGGITVALAPDGRLVATSAFGGQAALWDVSRPRHPVRLAVLRAGASNALWGEAFSPDSRLLAAAYGGGVALWDVARPAGPRLLTVLDARVGPVSFNGDIAFSPDGRLLALASGNGQVTIWNVTHPARGRPVATVTGHSGSFQALAFAPRGRLLAGVTTGGTLLVYRLDNTARPVLTAVRRGLTDQALYPGSRWTPSDPPTGCPGCAVPDYALGFGPGGRDLILVMDRGLDNFYSRDTVLTWPVIAPGTLGAATSASRDTRDGYPAVAPDGRTIVDGAIFGGTRVRLWVVPPAR
jgi:hypothetical protein